MEYKEYINQKKELYNAVSQMIENQDIDMHEFDTIYEIIQSQKILENREEVILFLRLLVQISNNHHRFPNFFNKILTILRYFYKCIKQTFTNLEIFKHFQSNKLIVLYLIKDNIITIDENFVTEIFNINSKKDPNYHLFFYPEINNFDPKLIATKLDIFNNLEQFDFNRQKGENENYICELIRNDLVEDFIIYVNRRNISLSKTRIVPSIFETNSFLIKNEPSLIEYAAFYGSIQIFQYLKMNNVILPPSLWLYAIHSQNAEIIHLLEENSINPPYYDYMLCYNESVKCHHNEIADYFINVFLVNIEINNYKYILKSGNFQQISLNIDDNSFFYNLFQYNYSTLANLYIKSKIDQYKKMEISQAVKENNTEAIYVLLMSFNEIITSFCFPSNSTLTQIVLPSNITEIGKKCFSESHNLKHIIIPPSVTKINEFAFNECCNLEKISIPSSVTFIGPRAFGRCTSLKQISLSSSLTKIETELFIECKKLEEISIQSSVTFIGSRAFKYCKSLKKIVIPSSVTCINSEAFYGCSSLKSVIISKSVTEIGNEVFAYCTYLSQAYVPNSVKYMGNNVFYECPLIDEFNLSEDDDKHDLPVVLRLILIWNSFIALFFLPFEIIISIAWWARIHPWFAHGYKSGKIVYGALEVSWISAICALVFLVLYNLMFFNVLKCFQNKVFYKRKIKHFRRCELLFSDICAILAFATSLISFISLIVASTYALKREKYNGVPIKCLNYIINGYQGAKDWAINQSSKKQNDLNKWYSIMLNNAYSQNGKISEYYCFQVGIPALIFTIFYFIAMLLYFCAMISCIC